MKMIEEFARQSGATNENVNKAMTTFCFTQPQLYEFSRKIIEECCNVIDAARPGIDQLPAEIALDIVIKNIKSYMEI